MSKGGQKPDDDLGEPSDPNLGYRVEVKNVPLYFGNLEDEVEEWFCTIERIALANGWKMNFLAKLVPAYLRSKAAEAWESLPIETQQDYQEMKSALVSKFSQKGISNKYSTILRNRKQAKDENVLEYGRSIHTLVRKSYPDMDMKGKEQVALDCFKTGLRSEIRRFVVTANPKSFDDAVAIASEQMCYASFENTEEANSSGLMISAAEMEDNVVEERMDRLEKLMTQMMAQQNNTLESIRSTLYRRGDAQPQRSAPRYVQPAPNTAYNNQNRTRFATTGAPICDFCGRRGHLKLNCRQRLNMVRNNSGAFQPTGRARDQTWRASSSPATNSSRNFSPNPTPRRIRFQSENQRNFGPRPNFRSSNYTAMTSPTQTYAGSSVPDNRVERRSPKFHSQEMEYGNYLQEIESLRNQNERLAERLLGNGKAETTPKTTWCSHSPGNMAFMMEAEEPDLVVLRDSPTTEPQNFRDALVELKGLAISSQKRPRDGSTPCTIEKKSRPSGDLETPTMESLQQQWAAEIGSAQVLGKELRCDLLIEENDSSQEERLFESKTEDDTTAFAKENQYLEPPQEDDWSVEDLMADSEISSILQIADAVRNMNFVSIADETVAMQAATESYTISTDGSNEPPNQQHNALPSGEFLAIISTVSGYNKFEAHLVRDLAKAKDFSVFYQLDGFRMAKEIMMDCAPGEHNMLIWYPLSWRTREDGNGKIVCSVDLLEVWDAVAAGREYYAVNTAIDYAMRKNHNRALVCQLEEDPSILQRWELGPTSPIAGLIDMSIKLSKNGIHPAKITSYSEPSNTGVLVWPYRCLECLTLDVWPELKIGQNWDQMRLGFCLTCEESQPFRQVAQELGLQTGLFVQDNWATSQLTRSESLPKEFALPDMQAEADEEKDKDNIWPFFGTHNIFSNMYKIPIHIDGQEYNCNEQYYTYKKVMWIPDLVAADIIMTMTDPKEMKGLAKDAFEVLLSEAEADIWRTKGHAIKALWEANWAKYNQHSDFKQALLETKETLIVEASYDRYWGAGCGYDDENLYRPHRWKGHNEMGKLLMRVRCAIRQSEGYMMECNYATNGNKMPLVIGRIGLKLPVEFLVDSGCNLSLIRRSVLKRDSAYKKWEPPKGEKCQTARSITGGSVELLGQVDVHIQLGNESVPHRMFVVEQAPYDAVLGTDFMKLHGVTLDLGLGQMYIGSSALKLWTVEDSPGEKVCLDSSMTVPPWSEVVTLGCLEKPKTCQGLLEGRDGLSEIYSIEVANELVKPSQGKVPLRLANLTSNPVFLHDTLHVASYAPVLSIERTDNNLRCFSAEYDTDEHESSSVTQIRKIDLSGTDLTETQKDKLIKFLEDNEDVFSKGGYDVGHTTLVQHTINTGDNEPIKQRPYRIPEALKEDVHRQLREMEEKGIIRPSASPWCAPMVIVKKKSGENRLCIDYRKLNTITKADVFPLPRIDGILDKLGNAAYFSSLDLASGYYQIEVADADKEKTAFSTGDEIFEFVVMPFGLKTAPATFQRLMQFVLTGLPSCFVYIDDILVTSTGGFDNHLVELSNVFDRLRQGNLKLKPAKCSFGVRKVAFLGHVVSSEGIAPNPDKIKAISDFPNPTDARSLKRFLGTCSYFRTFVEGFSIIGAPLFGLLKKNAPFIWTPGCEDAFNQLKKRLAEHPILVYPDFAQSFRLHTDASDQGLGAILTQMRSGKDHAIAYASRSLAPAEKNYSVTEKEALAVVWGVSHFRHYLYGHQFTVITDHQPLRWLMGIKNPIGRLARWSLTLQEYDFDVVYRPGKTNCADGLSRSPIDIEERDANHISQINVVEAEEISNASPIAEKDQVLVGKETATTTESEEAWGPEEVQRTIKEEQRKEPDLQEVIQFLETGESHLSGAQLDRLQQKATSYFLKDGCLYHSWQDSSLSRRPHNYNQLVVPIDMIPEILESFHDDVFSGHLGFDRTYHKIRQRFYFDGMYDIIRNWCRTCTSCQTRKPPGKYHCEPMRPITSSGPFDICVVDCLGPLPITESGNKYVVIFQDHFTKWPEAFATNNIQAITVAELLIEQIVCRHSAPSTLLSDRGPCFISSIVQAVCDLVNTRKVYATAYRPQTQGLVERMNRTLTEMLSQYVSTNQKDWDKSLNFVLFAYRTSIHDTTQVEPFYLLYGRMPTFPIEAMLSSKCGVNSEPSQYIVDLRKRITAASTTAKRNLAAGQQKQKAEHDKRVSLREFRKGDKVWLRRATVPKNLNKKLIHKWTGLHQVQEAYGDGNLLLKALQGGKEQMVHAERCKLAMPADQRIVSEKDRSEYGNEPNDLQNVGATQQVPYVNPVTGSLDATPSDLDDGDDQNFLPLVEEPAIERAVETTNVRSKHPKEPNFKETEGAKSKSATTANKPNREELPASANDGKSEATTVVAPRADGTSWKGRLRGNRPADNAILYLLGLMLLLFTSVFGAENVTAAGPVRSLEVKAAPGIMLNSAYGVLFQDDGLLDNAHDYLQHAFIIPYKFELDHPTKITICDDNITSSKQRTTFQKEFGLADHTNQLINDLCKLVKLVNARTYIGFRSMNARVGFIANDLKLLSSSVEKPNGRNKRNILSGLWCLLESLFGSCKNDGVDAKTLRSAMHKMEQRFDRTSVEIDSVSKKVTSFAKMSMAGFRNIDYRFNEVNQESLAIQDAQQKVVRNVRMLTSTLDRTLLAIKIQTNLVLQYAYLSTRMREWQAQQEGAHLIFQGLAFMSNGQLSPEIVPPHSLIKLLRSIQKKLKVHGVQLAYAPTRIDQYYHLHLVRSIQISDGHIVINTRMPVARSNSLYQLWKVIFTSLPGPNGSYLGINSQHDVLAVGQGASQYIAISREQLDTCGHHRLKSCPFVFPSVPVSFPSCLWALWKKRPHVEVAQYCDVVIEHRQHLIRSFDLGKGLWFITDVSGDWRLFCSKKSPVSVKSCSQCIISLPCGCGLSTPSINLPMRFHDCPHPRYTIQWDYNPFLYPNITVGSGFNLTADVINPTIWAPISHYFNHSLAPQTELMVNFSRYIKWTEKGRQEFLTVDQQLSEKVDESIEHIKQVQNLGQWKFYGLLCGELVLGLLVLVLLLKDYLQRIIGGIAPGITTQGSYRVTYKRRPQSTPENVEQLRVGEHPAPLGATEPSTPSSDQATLKRVQFDTKNLDSPIPVRLPPDTDPSQEKRTHDNLEYAEIGKVPGCHEYANWTAGLKDHKGMK